jgi:GNAT superfamily N-acetyltransferase
MRVDDLEPIRAIEVRAGALFHQVGKPDIAGHPVPSAGELARFVDAGRSWVLAADGDVPAGFVLVDLVDGLAHIEQVSVDSPYARRGLGSTLMDHVGSWAAGRNIGALTLTTFREVPWNAPYYARLGFVELADEERGPELAALMADEAQHGLDPAERVAMIRPIDVPRETSLTDVDGLPARDLLQG